MTVLDDAENGEVWAIGEGEAKPVNLEPSLLQCAENVVTAWDKPGMLAEAVRNLDQAIHREHFKPDAAPEMKIWTISCDMEDGERPVVDIVHCDHEPTWPEVVKIHPHLKDYNPEEDRVIIEQYTDIPTIQ